MQVGTADTAGAGADEDLTLGKDRVGDGPDKELTLAEDGGAHLCLLRFAAA
jgi:hypothetical protein